MDRKTVTIFRALSHPSRLRIVKMLEERELCVCEVRAILGLSTSTVSKHLTILCDAGLIVDTRDGKWVNYKLNSTTRDTLIRPLLSALKTGLETELQIKADRDRARTVDRNKLCSL